MRFAIPVAAALLLGFLLGHGTEAPVDLFILLTSIALVYGGIGMSELLPSLPRPRRTARGGTRPVGANRLH
jgi:hypothetical protein